MNYKMPILFHCHPLNESVLCTSKNGSTFRPRHVGGESYVPVFEQMLSTEIHCYDGKIMELLDFIKSGVTYISTNKPPTDIVFEGDIFA